MSVAEMFYEDSRETDAILRDEEKLRTNGLNGVIEEDKEALSAENVIEDEVIATEGLAKAVAHATLTREDGEAVPRRRPATRITEPSLARSHHANGKRIAHGKGEDSDEDLLKIYLQEIGQHPLLTKDDEARLGKIMETAHEASAYLNDHPDLSEVDRDYYEVLIADGKQAAKEFSQANLRLVVSIAKKYQASGLPLLDLIQEGNLGLIHAVEKFDYRKGFKFSTYGTWWIKQSITRGIANTKRTIRIPVHTSDEIGRMLKARKYLEQELGREATVAELAEELGTAEEKLVELMAIGQDPISLSETLREDSDTVLGDVVEDKSVLLPDDEVMESMKPALLNAALSFLDERERAVIRLRFGLDSGEPRTLEDIGEHFGLTHERIRQIEARALTKLRHPSNKVNLKDLLGA